jgi:hypothetical protein
MSWIVWCPERGQDREDGRSVDAHSAAAAAERWAEQDDARSADYMIVRGNDATVLVAADCEGSTEHKFIVSGESRPEYRARMAT